MKYLKYPFHQIIIAFNSWLRTDLSPVSGSAVIEVDLPTGWHVKKETLNKHKTQAIRSHPIKEKVIWYTEYVSNSI